MRRIMLLRVAALALAGALVAACAAPPPSSSQEAARNLGTTQPPRP